MIQLSELSLYRGSRCLLESANLMVPPGTRLALIGANGAGKSTLFALLRGQLTPDGGNLELPPNWQIAHVAQETPALDCSALDFVLDGDPELRQWQQQLALAEATNDGHQIASAHEHLSAIDAYTANSRAGSLLHGLGFEGHQQLKAVREFSGGWRMRLNLAQALMCRSDLLLLDEPTNHLDLEAVLWLEQWLLSYSGTLIIISHDMDFLDVLAQGVVQLEHQKLTYYSGNYSDFERQKAARLIQQQALFEQQQRQKAHLQAYIDRFRAKASKARQAQSRIKALARMEQIGQAHLDSPFQFEFADSGRAPNPLIKLESVSLGYQLPILSEVGLTLAPGSRIALLGPNGAGKSSLIKLLAGQIPAQSGEVYSSPGVRLGYFAQQQLEHLDLSASPLIQLQRIAGRASEQSLRDFLGKFGFGGALADAPTEPFSGGEKARLALALLVYQKPNLLLMDEPTNHLDLDMRHALLMALQDFDGALVLVSHDRHLLRTSVDEFYLVADGKLSRFDGDLDDYGRWLNQRAKAVATTSTKVVTSDKAVDKKEQRRLAAEQRQQLQPLKKKIAELERQLEQFNQQLKQLEQQLAEPDLYEPEQSQSLKKLLQQQTQLKQQAAQSEEAWLSSLDELESRQARLTAAD